MPKRAKEPVLLPRASEIPEAADLEAEGGRQDSIDIIQGSRNSLRTLILRLGAIKRQARALADKTEVGENHA